MCSHADGQAMQPIRRMGSRGLQRRRIREYLVRVTNKRTGVAELFSGLGAIALLGALYALTGAGVFIFFGVIVGVLPAIRGLSKVVQARVGSQERKELEVVRSETRERTVLRLARSESGRLTPAIVAVNSELTLDDAEKQLREFADKGYAELNVTDDGRIEYLFPEFLGRETRGLDSPGAEESGPG
jgi:hypothetical protein